MSGAAIAVAVGAALVAAAWLAAAAAREAARTIEHAGAATARHDDGPIDPRTALLWGRQITAPDSDRDIYEELGLT